MKKTVEHETDARGRAIFRDVFVKWGVNESEEDYGWDFAVEVFRNQESTGLIFNAQLKSSTVTAYSSDGSFISQPLETKAAEYLASRLQQPTFLFHADVEAKRLYWSAIQLDDAVFTALEKGVKSLTVRIPTSNLLPDKFGDFAHDLRKAHGVVAARALMITKDMDFVDAMLGHTVEKKDEVAEDLHEKAHRVEAQAAHEIYAQGNLPESKRRLKAILDSPNANLHTRFNVTSQLGDVEWTELLKSGAPQVQAVERLLATGRELCEIAKGGPMHLRLVALITRTAGELAVLVHTHLGLTMNWQVHEKKKSDPVWLAILSFRLDENAAAVARKYRQGIRLASIVARSSYRWVAPVAVLRIAREIPAFASLLDLVGLKEIAAQYRKSAFQIVRMAAAIATENKDIDDLLRAVMAGLLIDPSEDGEIYAWSRSLVEKWSPESLYRQRAEQFTSNIVQRKKGIKLEGDMESTDRHIYQNVLSGFGIDPESQPWAGMIELAIKDSNPERVLKHCIHTFVSGAPMPQILRRMGLHHAGPKTLHCTLHKYAVDGPDLDSINDFFTKKYCDSCKDRTPRPEEWKFSHEWQDGENQRFSDYLDDFIVGKG